MTFFKIFHPHNLDEPEKVADYFELDALYLKDFLQATGQETDRIDGLIDSITRKLEEDQTLNEEESRFLGAIFVADAEWLGPNSEWYSGFLKYVLQLGDGFVHHEWMDVAKNYADLSEFSIPSFSEPSDHNINENNLTDYNIGFIQRVKLIAAVTQLEWCVYVCEQMDIELEDTDIGRIKIEGIEYFVGEREQVSGKTADVHSKLFQSDAEWLKGVKQIFGIRSLPMSWARKEFSKTAEELE